MKTILTAALAAALFSSAAVAAPFAATPDIFTGSGYAARYVGPGGNVQPSNRPLGSIWGGGADTFDAFGYYLGGTGGLQLSRQVELLNGNVFRFFDTFTNSSNRDTSVSVSFFGNLGSDGDELVSHDAGGLMVSCQEDGNGVCIEDAVLALVSGNNGAARATITPDRYRASYQLNVAAGQSVSLLNFAFLARGEQGPDSSDITRATQTGLALLRAPRLEGLSQTQIGQIANFTLAAPVPEPATWLTLILGFGAIGASVRLRNRPASASRRIA